MVFLTKHDAFKKNVYTIICRVINIKQNRNFLCPSALKRGYCVHMNYGIVNLDCGKLKLMRQAVHQSGNRLSVQYNASFITACCVRLPTVSKYYGHAPLDSYV